MRRRIRDNQPSFFTLQVNCTALEDIPKFKRNHVGHAKRYSLSAGTNTILTQNINKDGRLSLLAFGGQFGKREIKGVLKTIKLYPETEDEVSGPFLFLV